MWEAEYINGNVERYTSTSWNAALMYALQIEKHRGWVLVSLQRLP